MAPLMNFTGPGKRQRENTMPVETADFVVIDTELTGLNERKDSIVSVGAVRMCGGTISLGDSFYRLVKPRTALTRESVIIHGIMPSDVEEQEAGTAVLTELLQFCSSAILVGHYVLIDLAFIDRELRNQPGRLRDTPVIDTAELYSWMTGRRLLQKCMKDAPARPDLYRLAQCLDIPLSGSHHAMSDAFITAQVFQRFLPLLAQEGISTVGDLIRIGDPNGGGDRFRSSGEIGNL